MLLHMVKDKSFYQLEGVLQTPIVELEHEKHYAELPNVKHLINNSPHCCIVVATSTGSNKLQNLKNLYRCMSLLKRLRRQLCEEYPSLETNLIGIYPSLDYPACVYELNTNAARYVANNVLPYPSSPLISTIKHLISKLLGTNPAVGGLGLTVYKE